MFSPCIHQSIPSSISLCFHHNQSCDHIHIHIPPGSIFLLIHIGNGQRASRNRCWKLSPLCAVCVVIVMPLMSQGQSAQWWIITLHSFELHETETDFSESEKSSFLWSVSGWSIRVAGWKMTSKFSWVRRWTTIRITLIILYKKTMGLYLCVDNTNRWEEDTVWESNKSHWQTWNRKSLANRLTALPLNFSLLLQVFSWSFAGDCLKFALTFPYNFMLEYRWGENSALDSLRALAWLCVIWKDRAEALKQYKSFLNVNVTATAVPYFVIRVLSFQR